MPPRQVGDYLLSNYLFIHLARPGDKMNLALHMLLKLYSLVDGQCCEDNPDALTHHEVGGGGSGGGGEGGGQGKGKGVWG